MSKWDFVVKELKALQQDFEDKQPIVELYVNQILLKGYKISKGVQYNKGTVGNL